MSFRPTQITQDEMDELGRLLARLVAPHLVNEPSLVGNDQSPTSVSAATDGSAAHRSMAADLRSQGLSKSETIRRLFSNERLTRSQIAVALDVRYQFVQNVLKQAGLLPPKTEIGE